MENPSPGIDQYLHFALADFGAAIRRIDHAAGRVLAAYEAVDQTVLTACLEVADSEEGEAYTEQLRLAALGQQQTPPGIYALEVVKTHFSATDEGIYGRAEVLAAEGLRDTIAQRRQELAEQAPDRAEAQRRRRRAFWDGFMSVFDLRFIGRR